MVRVMPFRFRKSAAALCLAIAVFAVVVPGADWFIPVVVTPEWLLVPPQQLQPLDRESWFEDEQLVSYGLLAPSRAPPASS
jgi:hypothetical protein